MVTAGFLLTYDEEKRVTSKEVPHIGKAVYVYDIIKGVYEGCVGERSVELKEKNNDLAMEKSKKYFSEKIRTICKEQWN
jgi:hypothetical protein